MNFMEISIKTFDETVVNSIDFVQETAAYETANKNGNLFRHFFVKIHKSCDEQSRKQYAVCNTALFHEKREKIDI